MLRPCRAGRAGVFNELREMERQQKGRGGSDRFHSMFQIINCAVLHDEDRDIKLPNVEQQQWESPSEILTVPVEWTNAKNMFFQTQAPSKALQLDALQRGRGTINPETRENVTWRAAGAHSNYRATAAINFLEYNAEHDFRDIPNSWAGCLLKSVGLVVISNEGFAFVSLGFYDYAAYMWQLIPCEPGSKFMQFTGAPKNPHQAFLLSVDKDICPLKGLPVRVSVPASRQQFLDKGILLEISGEPLDLLEHLIRSGDAWKTLTTEDMKNICVARSFDLMKPKSKCTKGDLWEAIVRALIPAGPDQDRLLAVPAAKPMKHDRVLAEVMKNDGAISREFPKLAAEIEAEAAEEHVEKLAAKKAAAETKKAAKAPPPRPLPYTPCP